MKVQNAHITSKASILLTDSRFVDRATESIFFAIKGVRHDGHQFIDDLIKKGVTEFVIEASSVFTIFDGKTQMKNGNIEHLKTSDKTLKIKDLTFYIVPNSTIALQDFVRLHRAKFNIPIVGITGSNGKTIVKEWLFELASTKLNVVKSPRSYNSQIGVPLSVWQLNEASEFGIFEAGISQKVEMQRLSEVIQPTIGIFTNIGSAHDEGFNSRREKIAEKLRLFSKSEKLIYCSDHTEIDIEVTMLLKAINPQIELINWSLKNTNKQFVSVITNENTSQLKTKWQNEDIEIEIPFTDIASTENCIHVLFALLQIFPPSQLPSFMTLKPLKMRLEMKHGIQDNYLIDDTYNNDLGGLEMALNFLNQHSTKRDKLLIISDILESGLPDTELYEKLKNLVISKGINEIIGIGKAISKHKPLPGHYFVSTDDFLANLPLSTLQSRFILIKGARRFSFERIVKRLEQKIHGTVFEINLDALQHNLNFYRSKLKGKTKLMAMVKAYAYGSGSTEIAAFLQYHRVDYLAVAYTDEGVTLRQNGIKLPIMVLNPQPETYQNLVNYQLEPEIYSLKSLNDFTEFLTSIQHISPIKIHLKLDTGMHRLGFVPEDIPKLIQEIKINKKLTVASVFSHLAGADERKFKEFTQFQITNFEKMAAQIQLNFSEKIDRHICNTAGILSFPEAHYEMVRLGIGLYGVDSTGVQQSALKSIGRLKTVISQVKTIEKGETVGYSRKGKIDKPSKIATIAIGYADGYDRGFGNGVGSVLIGGKLCPTIGNVCMDMTMIDVTETTCKEGDEVIVFGENPTINELAKLVDTIPYEILTNVGERVKRVFYKE